MTEGTAERTFTGDVSPDERAAATRDNELARERHAVLAEGNLAPVPDEVRAYVSYVADPKHANDRFLVKAGVPQKLGIPSVAAGIHPLGMRDGDIWAVFVDGILTTNEELVIEWCNAHSSICRPASDPRTRAWVQFKDAQTNKDNQEAAIDGEVNIDELLFNANMDAAMGDKVLREGRPDDLAAAAVAGADKRTADERQRQADPTYVEP